MSAREEILDRIRAALSHAPTVAVVAPRARSSSTSPTEGVLDRFVERVEEYGAVVHRCGEAEAEAVLRTAVRDASGVIVPPDLPWTIPGAVVDSGHSAAALDELEAAVTSASVAIAETGTVVLAHGPGEGRRALSLVADLHVCLLRADQVVPDVPEAVAALDSARLTTWISGPSATSDIELSRVEGVHGPRRLVVILIED